MVVQQSNIGSFHHPNIGFDLGRVLDLDKCCADKQWELQSANIGTWKFL